MASLEELKRLRAEAQAQHDRGEHTAAIATCDRVLALATGDPDALFLRGLARLSLGENEGAREDFDRYHRVQPTEVAAVYNRGLCAFRLGRHAEALPDFDEWVRAKPDHPNGLVQRGRCRKALKDADGAMADFDKALEVKPDHVDARFHRGLARQDKQMWEEAIADYTRVLALAAAGNPNAWYNRAFCRTQLGDPFGALEDLGRYLARYPDDADSLQLRGFRRLDLGEWRRAAADLARAITVNPKLEANLRPLLDDAARLASLDRDGVGREVAVVCCRRGRDKLDIPQWKMAAAWFTRAIDADPAFAEGWHGRALAHLGREEHAEAIPDLDRALELDPSVATAWADRGRAKRLAGDAKGAVSDLQRARDLAPDMAATYLSLGYAHAALLDWAASAADLERYGALVPTDANGWIHLAWAREQLGQHAPAIAAYTKVLELQPHHALALGNRGQVRVATGDKAGALADFRAAIEAGSDRAEAIRREIAALEAAGTTARASVPAAAPNGAQAPAAEPGSGSDPATYVPKTVYPDDPAQKRAVERAVVCRRKNDRKGVAAALTEAVSLGARGADLLEWCGMARRAVDDARGAVEAWQMCLRIDPARAPKIEPWIEAARRASR